eukprot:364879-Chlamydomonas_euryale.AAC.2
MSTGCILTPICACVNLGRGVQGLGSTTPRREPGFNRCVVGRLELRFPGSGAPSPPSPLRQHSPQSSPAR